MLGAEGAVGGAWDERPMANACTSGVPRELAKPVGMAWLAAAAAATTNHNPHRHHHHACAPRFPFPPTTAGTRRAERTPCAPRSPLGARAAAQQGLCPRRRRGGRRRPRRRAPRRLFRDARDRRHLGQGRRRQDNVDRQPRNVNRAVSRALRSGEFGGTAKERGGGARRRVGGANTNHHAK